MATEIFIGVGVGAVCGGIAGLAYKKIATKPKIIKAAAAASSPAAPTSAVVSAAKAPQKTAAKTQEVFDVKTTYFTKSSEFYTMMVRFENYLQFAAERKSFKSAVEHIDNLLGMDALLNGRNPVAKAALPTMAESARRKVMQVLNDIVKFSSEERPSKTKEEAMNTIKEEINQGLLNIVKDMNRALAAMPFEVNK